MSKLTSHKHAWGATRLGEPCFGPRSTAGVVADPFNSPVDSTGSATPHESEADGPGNDGGRQLPCERVGQPFICEGDWVCDADPSAGNSLIHCQPPCQDRASPTCFIETACDPGGSGLCVYDRGAGVADDAEGVAGCMTRESCEHNDQCCDREGPLPRCGVAACGPNACRQHADCGGAQVCVDDACVDLEDRPSFCEDDSDCPGRQTCGAGGGCGLAGPCRVDRDCPGTLRCHAATGRCDECRADAECERRGLGVECGDSRSGLYRKCLEAADGVCLEDGG